jgi:hypothetical protein
MIVRTIGSLSYLPPRSGTCPTLILVSALPDLDSGATKETWTDVMIFKNIFAKNRQKVGTFDSKQSQIMQKVDHNIGF